VVGILEEGAAAGAESSRNGTAGSKAMIRVFILGAREKKETKEKTKKEK